MIITPLSTSNLAIFDAMISYRYNIINNEKREVTSLPHVEDQKAMFLWSGAVKELDMIYSYYYDEYNRDGIIKSFLNEIGAHEIITSLRAIGQNEFTADSAWILKRFHVSDLPNVYFVQYEDSVHGEYVKRKYIEGVERFETICNQSMERIDKIRRH